MSAHTVQLHRVLRTTPEKVYRAFLEPDAMARWLPPEGYTCSVHHMEVCVGATFKMSFTNFTNGNSFSFGGTYLELVPFQLIRYSTKFDDANLPGDMLTVVTLKPVSCGTELHIVQSGIPEVVPAEMAHLGWQESLQFLAKLVEPDIRE